MHAVAGGVGHHRAAAVHDVSSRDLLVTGLKNVIHHPTGGHVALPLQNRKDCPDGDVDVDVARPIERVEQNDVLGVFIRLLDNPRLVVLLRDHDADVAAISQAGDDRLVGEHVELLDPFALHVRRTRPAEDVEKSGARTLAEMIRVASRMPASSQLKSPLAVG